MLTLKELGEKKLMLSTNAMTRYQLTLNFVLPYLMDSMTDISYYPNTSGLDFTLNLKIVSNNAPIIYIQCKNLFPDNSFPIMVINMLTYILRRQKSCLLMTWESISP